MVSLRSVKDEERNGKAPEKMRVSVEVYQEMEKAGIFSKQSRVELINGEIYTISPLTPDHNGHVDKASRFFNKVLFDEALIRTQGSIQMDNFSEPEPDVAVLRLDDTFYSKTQASSKDVYLLVEVAVFTMKYDQTIKKTKYANANIPEYWIIIPRKQTIEVYRKPKDGKYTEKRLYKKEDTWRIEMFDLEVKGSDFLI